MQEVSRHASCHHLSPLAALRRTDGRALNAKPLFGRFCQCPDDNFFGGQPKETEMQVLKYSILAMVWFNVVLAA